MPDILYSETSPFVIGEPNNQAVLVRALAYSGGGRVGDVLWVSGDGVDQLVSDGFYEYVTAEETDQTSVIPDTGSGTPGEPQSPTAGERVVNPPGGDAASDEPRQARSSKASGSKRGQ